MKCPNCNFELPENTKFCPECGSNITTESDSVPHISEADEVPADTILETNNRKTKNKKKLVIILVASVASVIFVCGIIFWLMQNPFCLFYHNNACYKVIKSATCTEAGLEDAYCEDCGDFLWSRTVPAKGHNIEWGMCVDCKEISDAHTVLVHYAKTNGEETDGYYFADMGEINGMAYDIYYDSDSDELSFLCTADSLMVILTLDPDNKMKQVGMVALVNGEAYNSIAYINAPTFNANNSNIVEYRTDAPINMEDLLSSAIVFLVENSPEMLTKTGTGVTMEMLDFEAIE